MCRFIYILLFSLTLTVTHGQPYNFKTKDEVVKVTMNKAIINAGMFIQNVIPKPIFEKHFQFDYTQSVLQKNDSFPPVSFNDSINFIPNKYAVTYAVLINGDTLSRHFEILVDSIGNVLIDTTEYNYIWEDIKAYQKLLTGEYSFDFKKLKQFIQTKNLKNYSIAFMSSMFYMESVNYETPENFKHYWYVTEHKKDAYVRYTVDPETGKVTIIKRKFRYDQNGV